MISMLLCYLPLGLVLLTFIMACLMQYQRAKRDRDKAEFDAQREELRIAKEHNALVLQDTRLELDKLKILKLRHDLRLDDKPFDPKDYPF